MRLISAIVPTYNSASTIWRALLSIENQDWQQLEVVCVDDASTDDTVQLITDFSKSSKRNIRCVTLTKNMGAGVARNAGIENANGKYIAFLDADDEWDSKKISTQYKAMCESGAVISHTYYERVNRGEVSIARTRDLISYSDMLLKNHIGTSTVMLNRDFLGSRRFPLLRKRQDYGLWLTLLRDGGESLAVKVPLTKYHMGSGSLSRSSMLSLLKHNYLVFRKCERFSVLRSVFHVCLNVYARIAP